MSKNNRKYSSNPHKELGEIFWEFLLGHRGELDMTPIESFGLLNETAILKFFKRNEFGTGGILDKILDQTQKEIGNKVPYKVKTWGSEPSLSWAVVSATTNASIENYNKVLGTNLGPRKISEYD